MRKTFKIIVLIAVIGFSLVTCKDNGTADDSEGSSDNSGNDKNNGKDSNKDGNSGSWRWSKEIYYTVKDGVVGSVDFEVVPNWIRYTNNNNYEYKCTYTYPSTSSTIITNQMSTSNINYTYTSNINYEYEYKYIYKDGRTSTIRETRNGQTGIYTSEDNSATASSSFTTTTLYDSASGLEKQISHTSTSTDKSTATTTTSTSNQEYTITSLGDSGVAKTYRQKLISYTVNNVSQDVSNNNVYTECKIQDGKTVERKTFTYDGTLIRTETVTQPTNAVIRTKLPNLTLTSSTSTTYGTSPSSTSFSQTVDVLSDSATELVIRYKQFSNNSILSQYDTTYKKFD